MKEAVEQRQTGTWWVYSQGGSRSLVQNVPWLVNSFFSKAEGLLPRVKYDAAENTWVDDPYNVPELPYEYPKPSIFGILPACGCYARHTEGLIMQNVRFSFMQEDKRPAIVLDDTADTFLQDINADIAEDTLELVCVANQYKRHTGLEYIPGEPYFSTGNEGLKAESLNMEEVTVDCPAPGTSADDIYPNMKLPIPEYGYSYAVPTEEYELPRTVFRPYFRSLHDQTIKVGDTLSLTVEARNPADGIPSFEETPEAVITDNGNNLVFGTEDLPKGASFDAEMHQFTFTPNAPGEYEVTFTLDDGVIPVRRTVTFTAK